MKIETREDLTTGLDIAIGVCYALRKNLAPLNENTTDLTVNDALKEEIQNIDELLARFEKIKMMVSDVEGFLKKPEVQLLCNMLLKAFEKYMERKERKINA